MNSPRTAGYYKPHGVFSPIRTATLLEPVKGRFCKFEIGEHVRIITSDGERCCIERVTWQGKAELQNQCAGVPRSSLDFE